MSPRYLYALLDAEPTAPPGRGLADEPVHIVACDGFFAATGDMATAPAPSAEAVRGHDAVVRRLARSAEAVLPARFGMLLADDGELRERLGRTAGALREALARVAGREQMIVRIYAPASSAGETSEPPSEAAGPGLAYLTARAHRRADPEALARLRGITAPFVLDERIERHAAPPLIASLYHLIARGRAAEYTAAVEGAIATLGAVSVRVSGPWAPYAFVPDVA